MLVVDRNDLSISAGYFFGGGNAGIRPAAKHKPAARQDMARRGMRCFMLGLLLGAGCPSNARIASVHLDSSIHHCRPISI